MCHSDMCKKGICKDNKERRQQLLRFFMFVCFLVIKGIDIRRKAKIIKIEEDRLITKIHEE